eukprot:6237411-Pyramimonas_sp.AAC.1
MGDPFKTPTRPLSTGMMLGAKLNGIRCDSVHEHTSVINSPKETSSLGQWTASLAKTIIDGIEHQRSLEKQHGRYARCADIFDGIGLDDTEANPAEAEVAMHA